MPPSGVAGMVVITPAYDPAAHDREGRFEHWDALADGLEHGGIEGFIAASGRPDVPESWQETVEKVTRQRLSQHEHLDAVADALRAVPRSRPFGEIAELATRSPCRRSSWRAPTSPIPAILRPWGRRTPRRSPAPASCSTSPDAPRSPGRAASCRRLIAEVAAEADAR